MDQPKFKILTDEELQKLLPARPTVLLLPPPPPKPEFILENLIGWCEQEHRRERFL